MPRPCARCGGRFCMPPWTAPARGPAADYDGRSGRTWPLRNTLTRRWRPRWPSGWSLMLADGRARSMPRCKPFGVHWPTRLAGLAEPAEACCRRRLRSQRWLDCRARALGRRPSPTRRRKRPRAIMDAFACRPGTSALDALLRKGACSWRKRKTAVPEPGEVPRRAGGRARAAAPAAPPPPARRLAAPAAHGPPGALLIAEFVGRQARARLGGHERRGARRAGHAVADPMLSAGCRSGWTRACATC
jgi:hypothetical protein